MMHIRYFLHTVLYTKDIRDCVKTFKALYNTLLDTFDVQSL